MARRSASATSARLSTARNTTQAAWGNGKRSVFLIIFKQPAPTSSRPSIDQVRRLPRLQASIPPSIDVNILSDRTQTIRASVETCSSRSADDRARGQRDLRVSAELWATIIPSITVPLALLGACALMWAALQPRQSFVDGATIAVGFVVDDAIVMLENITRHIEEGEKPFEAALKGAGEIGFTIISICSR